MDGFGLLLWGDVPTSLLSGTKGSTSSGYFPAFLGLGGVLLGAIISTGTNIWMAVRKERAEEKVRAVERAILLKQAARVLESQLDRAGRVCEIALKQKLWPFREVPLPYEWPDNKKVLAAHASEKQWEILNVADFAMMRISQQIAEHIQETDKRLTVADSEFFESSKSILGSAHTTLGALIT